jgi:probable rRNA maturation factor
MMQRLNREWMGHDRPTDVLSFALQGPEGILLGDVYICPAVARRQAVEFGVPPREELLRLVVHGTLHLLGHDHPEGAGRTQGTMWRRQEAYLSRLA